MNIVTLDFETYFDDDYSLKKMTTEAYVRDPRFEVHGVGVRWSDGLIEWEDRDDVAEVMEWLSREADAILCHHAQFDGLILSHHFGVKPRYWLDTLSMARMVIGNHLSVSLESLAKHFGLAAKNVPYNLFKGKHWEELDAATQHLVADGCLHDVKLTWQIFGILARTFPAEEYRVVDHTIRMFTEPVLVGDTELLGRVWMDEERRKAGLLESLGVDVSALQSSDTFADLLRAEGVEPPTKEGKNGPIYAFAKTDDFMKEGLEDDGRVGDLVRARLGVRSTIDQTRAERLGWMATRGPLPVYLRYCGAHTTRWSGGDALNWQNFRRGGDIRRSIRAPRGHGLITLDFAQIECRMLNTLGGQWDVVEAFRDDRDIYSERASAFYGRAIGRDDKKERHLGKVLELGCGYGMGHAKLRATCRQGAMGGPVIVLDDDEANAAIGTYRSSHPAIVAYWGQAGRIIARLAGGPELRWGPMIVRDRRVYLPNGAWLNYETLEFDCESQNWQIQTRQGKAKIYGGKLVENVVQALARVVLSQAMLRIEDRFGLRAVNCTHDELLYVAPLAKCDKFYYSIKEEMERPPAWLPDLPLKVEGGVSQRYDK